MTAVTVFAGRAVRRIVRQPTLLVQSLFFPMVLLVLLLVVFGETMRAATGGDFIDHLLPLMVLQGATFGSIGAGMSIQTDLHDGMVARVRSMPVSSSAMLPGRVLADAGRILVSSVVIVVLGVVLGFRFDQGLVVVPLFLAIAVALGTGFTWLSVWLGTRAPSAESVNAGLSAPLLLMLFLCTGFAPIEAFPGWLQPVVRVNPLSCGTEALVGLTSGGAIAGPLLATAAWSIGLWLVAGLAARRAWKQISAR